jgi:hypothetical protein
MAYEPVGPLGANRFFFLCALKERKKPDHFGCRLLAETGRFLEAIEALALSFMHIADLLPYRGAILFPAAAR